MRLRACQTSRTPARTYVINHPRTRRAQLKDPHAELPAVLAHRGGVQATVPRLRGTSPPDWDSSDPAHFLMLLTAAIIALLACVALMAWAIRESGRPLTAEPDEPQLGGEPGSCNDRPDTQ